MIKFPDEWKIEKLGNISDMCLGKMLDQQKNKGELQPYLANFNVRWGGFDFSDLNTMKFEEKENDRYGLKFGDIIICEGGEPGRCAIWKNQMPNMKIQKALHRVRVREGYCTQFLYYRIFLAGISGELEKYFTGAAIKHLTGYALKKVAFAFPPLPTQKKIAAVLSAYDDLIENTKKRIKLLEEMAQRTYEEWFVRFKFPNHENTPINPETGLPVGWEQINFGKLIVHEIGGGWGENELSKEFSEAAYVIRGTDFQDVSTGNLNNIPFRFHKKSNLKTRKLKTNDIIFEVSGGSRTEGVAKTCLMTEELLKSFDNNVICASFCKLVRLKIASNSYFLYHYLQWLRTIKATEVFEIRSASSIVNYNWSAFLKFQILSFPESETIERFNKKVIPVHKEINLLNRQNQRLKEARDILLPRLMTGIIDVEQLKLPEV